MAVVFENKELERAALTDWVDPKRSVAVCVLLKQKVVQLSAVPDEATLQNWRSFHYMSEGQGGLRSIRLNDQWRLTFEISNDSSGLKINVIDVKQNH